MKKLNLILIIVFAISTIVNAQSEFDLLQISNEMEQSLLKENLSNSISENFNIEYVNSIFWTGVNDLAVDSNYAYCVFTNGLVVLDISDRSQPVFVSKLYLGRSGRGIILKDSYAYVTDADSGLQIIDVSDPASPFLAGSYDTLGSAYGVAISENYESFDGDGSEYA